MTDEEYIFRQTSAERKRIGRGDFNKKRKGGRFVRLPSDNLSKKEREKMNGEVTNYNMNKPVSWAEFKKWPQDLACEYIRRLEEAYDVRTEDLARMMGIGTWTLQQHRHKLGCSAAAGGFHGLGVVSRWRRRRSSCSRRIFSSSCRESGTAGEKRRKSRADQGRQQQHHEHRDPARGSEGQRCEADDRGDSVMYDSPIHVDFTEPVIEKLKDEADEYILRACQKMVVSVDKDELVKALQYDRDQYLRGFTDGRLFVPPAKTKGDQIRQMSDEELAEWISLATWRAFANGAGNMNYVDAARIEVGEWLDWLKQEVEPDADS